MSTIFSAALCRARKEAGFSTAYRFFYDNGGAQGIGFSYRQYLRMEEGKSLPECNKLNKLFLALRIPLFSTATHELAIAWLKTMTGKEAYAYVFSALIREQTGESALSPIHTVVKSAMEGRKYYINHEQYRAILTNPDTFICFTALSSDTGAWSADQTAKALRLSKEAADAAMKILAAVKILKRMKNGDYKCPLASKDLELPHFDATEPELQAKMLKYKNDLIALGTGEWGCGGILRADSTVLRNLYPVMMMNIPTAQAYAISRKTDRSALFYIECKVVKLRDF